MKLVYTGINYPCTISNNFISTTNGNWALSVEYPLLCNINNNTLYSNGTDYTCYISTTSSSAIINFNNNICYNNGKGYAINLNPFDSINANNNDYFTKGDNIGFYKFSDFRTIQDWRTGTFVDTNSVSINPGFINAPNGDFHISPKMKSIAYGGKILPFLKLDIDHEFRGPLYSIGADQIPIVDFDAAVISIDSVSSYSCTASQKTIWVTLKNLGRDTLKSVLVKWKVNGIARPDISWTGVLGTGGAAAVKLDTVNIIPGKIYPVYCSTDKPNSAADGNPGNDSANIVLGTGMMGNYTIGGNNPDFNSFRLAVLRLKRLGVCGAVTMNVRDGHYSESLIFESLQGSSLKNTITFQSQSLDSSKVSLDTIWGGSAYDRGFALKFRHASYITFREIGISNILDTLQSNNYGDVISIMDNSHHLNFENSKLLSNTTSQPLNSGYIINDLNSTMDSFITIQNNYISGGMEAIRLEAGTLDVELGNIIRHNYITGFSDIGIYASRQDSMNIEGNTIVNDTGSGIIISDNGTNFNGLDTSFVRNNFIDITGGGMGMLCTDNDMLNIYNNSLYVKNSASYAGRFTNSNAGERLNLFNNIFYNDSSGFAIVRDVAGVLASDNNNYFSKGNNYGMYNSKGYDIMKDWRSATGMDSKSITAKAIFKSAASGDLHLDNKSFFDIRNGKPLSTVSNDIDGEKRGGMPSIGADDIPLFGNDINLLSIDSPANNFCSGIKMIWVSIRNTGNTTISSVNIHWGVNGVARKSVAWAGTLKSGEIVKVKLDTVSFAVAVLKNIYAATNNPNGTPDKYTYNDSVGIGISASMSGTFTIGGTSPDFKTIRSAINFLNNAGVCGPVVFNIRDGKYNESMSLKGVYGASEINTITFQSQSLDSSKVTLDSNWATVNNPNGYYLDGASFFIFNKLTFTWHTSEGGSVIKLDEGAHNNVFRNNRIIGYHVYDLGLFVSGSDNNLFVNNYFDKCYEGISFKTGKSSSVSYGNIIRGNYINGANVGIYSLGGDSLIIVDNKIINTKSIGVYVYYNLSAPVQDTFVVSNNFVTSTYGCVEVYARRASVRNNSLYSNGTSAALSLGNNLPGTSCGAINNILYNNGTGVSAYFEATSGAILKSDFNDYYSAGKFVVSYSSVGKYTFVAWQKKSGEDIKSITGDPGFNNASNGDLHLTSLSSIVCRKGFSPALDHFDIDHQIRPYSGCDIGADQVSFNHNDIGVTEILYPGLKKCEDSINSVPVIISNLGLNRQTGFNVHVFANGPDTASGLFVFNATINPGVDTIVRVNLYHTLKTTFTGKYHFTAYTDLVNDTDRFSDTLSSSFNFRGGLVSNFIYRNPSCAGDITFLMDSSKGRANKYSWNFGDGHTSNKKNPLHVFIGPRKYYVSLKIKDATGCTDSGGKVISVDTADARFTTSYNGSAIDFTPRLSGLKHYTWDFGDGSTIDTIWNPSHSYPGNHAYRATLRISTQSGCIATWSDSVGLKFTNIIGPENPFSNINVYPNPFQDATNIAFTLDKPARVNIEIYDLQGKNLGSLFNQYQQEGSCNLNLKNFSLYPAGVYILQITVNTSVIRKTLIKLPKTN